MSKHRFSAASALDQSPFFEAMGMQSFGETGEKPHRRAQRDCSGRYYPPFAGRLATELFNPAQAYVTTDTRSNFNTFS